MWLKVCVSGRNDSLSNHVLVSCFRNGSIENNRPVNTLKLSKIIQFKGGGAYDPLDGAGWTTTPITADH